MKFFKNIQKNDWAVLPQVRPSSAHGVEEHFRLDSMQPFKHIQVYCWSALHNIFRNRQTHFAALKNRFVLMLCRLSTKFKSTDDRVPLNTVQLISRCWKSFRFWWYESFQNHSISWPGRAPQNTAQFLSRCWWSFSSKCCAAGWTHSYLWLGRAPQPLLSRPSSVRGVEDSFRRENMQTFNNVQMNGRLCTPKHGPALFTVLKICLIWIVWRFSKTFQLMAWPCSPKHDPVPTTVMKKLLCLDVMQPCKNIQVYGWAALLNFPCHGPAHFAALKNHFVLMLCKIFNNNHINGSSCSPKHSHAHFTGLKILLIWMVWSFSTTFELMVKAVLPLTRPSSFHGVEELFRLDVMQPSKNIQVYGWAALPDIPCHGPGHFAALKNHFVLMLCRLSTQFKWTAGRAPPNIFPLISRCWKLFSSGSYQAFQKHSNLWLGRALPNTAQLFSRCWKFFFFFAWFEVFQKHSNLWLGCDPPNTAQSCSRWWKTVSSGCSVAV